jgi:protein-L-isoaspartate(D-aspartate) O-methyltransferase
MQLNGTQFGPGVYHRASSFYKAFTTLRLTRPACDGFPVASGLSQAYSQALKLAGESARFTVISPLGRLNMAMSALQRKNMVESQVRPSDVTDRRITSAMQDLPRERFLPPSATDFAYMDEALTVAPGRSLMAPRTFARLLQLADIEAGHRVLIVGALYGYSAAVISRLAGDVVALESDATAASGAASALKETGIFNVKVVTGPLDGGWPAGAPYDAILIEGAIERIPPPLLDQMAGSGRLVTIEVQDAVGRAVVLQKTGSGAAATVSRRVAFDASAPMLPGFEQPKTFSF